ncbi:hypothetical protein LXL04_034382 [Taraxacum kok-saghyz]
MVVTGHTLKFSRQAAGRESAQSRIETGNCRFLRTSLGKEKVCHVWSRTSRWTPAGCDVSSRDRLQACSFLGVLERWQEGVREEVHWTDRNNWITWLKLLGKVLEDSWTADACDYVTSI